MTTTRMTFALLCLSVVLPAAAQTRAEFDDLRHRVEVLEQKSTPGAHTADASTRYIKLNGGLEAAVLSIGRSRNHQNLTVSMRIRNTGKNIAYLAGIGHQANAIDNAGVHFDFRTMNGIAGCNIGPYDPPAECLGIPSDFYKIPIQSFTRIDPSPQDSSAAGGIVINFSFSTNGPESTGPFVSMSANLLCRFVQDADVDETLSERDKYKQFHLMTLSFPPQLVTEAN